MRLRTIAILKGVPNVSAPLTPIVLIKINRFTPAATACSASAIEAVVLIVVKSSNEFSGLSFKMWAFAAKWITISVPVRAFFQSVGSDRSPVIK